MTQEMVVILGGYGGTGRELCRGFLAHTDARLVVAGRSLDKASAFAGELQAVFGDRVSAARADAADPASVAAACRGARLLVTAAPAPTLAPALADAIIEAGCDAIDIQAEPSVHEALLPSHERLVAAGRLFVSQSGFSPGLPGLLFRAAAAELEVVVRARAAVAICLKEVDSPEHLYSFVDLMPELRSEKFRDGAWRKARMTKDSVELELPRGFGRRRCIPMFIPELEPLPSELGIPELTLYAAGSNWFVDYLVAPSIMTLYGFRKGLGRRSLAKMMRFGVRHFSGAESGAALLLEADGTRSGQAQSLRMTVEHESPYVITALPVVALARQIFAGDLDVHRGLAPMAHVPRPLPFFAALAALGVTVTRTLT